MGVEVPGTLVGAGRNADVYDIEGGRVLRRYRDGRDVRRVDTEARVMMQARAAGVPVPEVFDVSGSDIVMERAAGPTMLTAIRYRLADPNLLPAEKVRLEKLVPARR
jgi:tRNA A-37 threonylcarbamoyl transferase component Bud32